MKPFIDIRGVSKVYPTANSSFEALKDIDLEVRNREFLSIVGPSGCGKSTLLKCMSGLESISGGSIRIADKAISGPPAGMGIVFQRDLLLDWRSIKENVLFIAEIRKIRDPALEKRAQGLLERFGLGDFADRYPWQLSGGMRQRAAICRAILDDPELLLMDEPFGALDAMTRDDLNLELARLWQDTRKTVVFITHSIAEAVFLSDRIAIMDRNPGRILEVVEVDLPRPRSLAIRETPQFGEYAHHIRSRFAEIGAIRAE